MFQFGGGGDSEEKGIFLLQKRVVQNTRGAGKQTYCRQIFRDLKMLPIVGNKEPHQMK